MTPGAVFTTLHFLRNLAKQARALHYTGKERVNRDNQDQYYKAIIYNRKALLALASVVNLALGRIVNYDHKLRSKLKRNLRS